MEMNYYASAIPRYQRIALEIASRIASGEYEEGQKLSGRSSIAGQYGVSPETARRAFSVLADLEIVEPAKGSGMFIKSREKSEEFIKQFSKFTVTGATCFGIDFGLMVLLKEVFGVYYLVASGILAAG